MPAVQLHTLNAAASDAAGSGDFPAAAALLRQLLESQTSLLGPDHPDLATTLNNLALMLERSGDTAEAGRCYRRALEVARLAHGPEAANVLVSQANLAAFYREHGADGNDDPNVRPGGLDDFAPVSVPVRRSPAVAAPATANIVAPRLQPSPAARQAASRPWRTPEAIVADRHTPEVRLPIFAARRAPAPLPAPAMRPLFVSQETPSSSWRRTAGSALILVLGIAVAGVPAWWLLRGATVAPAVTGGVPPGTGMASDTSSGGTGVKDEAAAVPTAESPLPESESDSALAAGPTTAAADPEVAARGTTSEDSSVATAPTDVIPSSGSGDSAPTPLLRVSEAGLCAELSIGQGPWHCEPTRNTARGGSVYYYTRVASPRDELIRHRWTRDGQLVQMVVLRILTNPGDGYRTFSRQSGPLLEAGTWRVALLTPDGRVLDETEFTVR